MTNSSQIIKIFCLFLIVSSVLAQTQSIYDGEIILTPIYEEQTVSADLTYTEPIVVARRTLQTVPVTTGTGQTMQSMTISKYSGLVVYHDFPQTWVIGEIFQIRGKLSTVAGANGTIVCFSFRDRTTMAALIDVRTLVRAGSFEFSLDIDTRSVPVGEFNIAFHATLSGSFYPSEIHKVNFPGAQANKISAPSAPTGCGLKFVENKLILSWNRNTNVPLNRAVFTQGSKSVTYIFSNFANSFEVPFKDFSNFVNASVTLTVASAYSSVNGLIGRMSAFSPTPWSYTFNAGQHAFSDNQPTFTLTSTPPLPWIVPVGTVITIQGSATVTLYSKIVVEEPQNKIGNYNITSASTTIPAGTSFSTNITLNKTGVYIVEVNANTGAAVLNRPVYVGNFLPLLPDFADLFVRGAPQPSDINVLRTNLLNLINRRRGAWGLASLSLDTNLNNLAQAHSNDMIARNFMGHVNPDRNGPQQRATLAGLNYGIGQNIAMNKDLTDAHNRLARSPGHLANIVGPTYTRVGLGIAADAQGYLYVTENYAAPIPVAVAPPKSDDLEKLRINVRNWILSAHPTAAQDVLLSSHVINHMALNSTTAPTIFNYLWSTVNYPSNFMSAATVTATYSPTLTSILVPGTHLKQPDTTFGKFGVGVFLQTDGKAKVQVVYAK